MAPAFSDVDQGQWGKWDLVGGCLFLLLNSLRVDVTSG